MTVLKYKIPKEYKVSTNKIYAWIHFRTRKKYADYFHHISKTDCQQLKQITKLTNLIFEFYFKSRYLDSSNCSFMGKCLEDWFVKNGLLIDDTNKYINQVTYRSVLLDKKTRKDLEWDYVRIIFN